MSKLVERCRDIKEVDGRYHLPPSLSRQEIINIALSLQFKNLQSRPVMENPSEVKNYFRMRLSDKSNEVFSVMFLSTKHQIIDCVDMFTGTIDSAQISVRDILVEVLRLNASAIIVAHNHPSGIPDPSQADKHITEEIGLALGLISVNLLDHIIVGDGCTVSLAEKGLMG